MLKRVGEKMNVLRNITLFVNDFFLYYIIVYGSILFISAVVGAIIFYLEKRKKTYKNEIERDYYVPISIIVPAYNEEVTIIDTIESLLNLDYKIYEIIVVDDGSSDKTSKKVIKHYNLQQVDKVVRNRLNTKKVLAYYELLGSKVSITLVKKANGGKADALNAGINAAHNPYFLTIDADSMLQVDALKEIAKKVLENTNIVACGGMIKISNGNTFKDGEIVNYELPHTFLEMIQTLEYDRTFLASRTVFDTFNGNIIISGAFGLFKKDTVIACGGYKDNTVGEDMELVIRLHDYCITNKIPYQIKYAPEAICWTQVPNKLSDFKKQRKRWHTGLLQSLSRHRNMFLNPKYGLVGFFSFIYYWVYELVAPITETVGLVFIFISYFLEMINFRFLVIYFLIYVLFCTIFTITSFFTRTYTQNYKITLADGLKVIFYSLIENFGFRQLVNYYRLSAFIGYRKNKLQWNKISRQKVNEE